MNATLVQMWKNLLKGLFQIILNVEIAEIQELKPNHIFKLTHAYTFNISMFINAVCVYSAYKPFSELSARFRLNQKQTMKSKSIPAGIRRIYPKIYDFLQLIIAKVCLSTPKCLTTSLATITSFFYLQIINGFHVNHKCMDILARILPDENIGFISKVTLVSFITFWICIMNLQSWMFFPTHLQFEFELIELASLSSAHKAIKGRIKINNSQRWKLTMHTRRTNDKWFFFCIVAHARSQLCLTCRIRLFIDVRNKKSSVKAVLGH